MSEPDSQPSAKPVQPTAASELDAVENKLAQIVSSRLSSADAGTIQSLLPKIKPEHIAALLELNKLAREHEHEERMAKLKATAEAELARLKNDAELTRAGPRLVLWLILTAFGFILVASAVFLGFQKPDLLPQIITAGLGLVTGLAGGYGIGRATTPTGKG